MYLFQRSREKNDFNFFVFWLRYPKYSYGHEIKFDSFLNQRIDGVNEGVNINRINNGPECHNVFDIAAREIFEKIWKLV